jgi:hypothetical protein
VKTGRKEKGIQLDAEGRLLRAHGKELDYREGLPSKSNRLRPRSKPASRSEAELRALGGEKVVISLDESRRQTRWIFGPKGQTRFIYTPEDGLWRLEGMPSREEQRIELCKSRRGLWDAEKKMPVIAFHAVDALLFCFESFKGRPSNKQQADQVQLAIIATLDALERDGSKRRKLQVAFELLNDPQWQTRNENLRHHAVMLACELQRPPSKKELKARFDPPLSKRPSPLVDHQSGLVDPSEFSRRLKAAGLSWLKRGQRRPSW